MHQTGGNGPRDPLRSARSVGLRYIGVEGRGIRREKGPLGFRYLGPDGKVIRKAATLKRIRALVIPPAWTDVWICTDPNTRAPVVPSV